MFIIIILFIILSIIIIINYLKKRELINYFNSNNVIVFGKKGTGKDLLFNMITNHKKFYYTNIPYTNKNYELFNISDLKLGLNDYESLLNNNVIRTYWNFKENCDFFISDGGVFLPSQYDAVLHKKYKGLSLIYALSRHIGNHNIHTNVQNLERLWKPLREQADIYIKTLGITKLPFLIKLNYRIYDKYSSAVADIRTIKSGIFKDSDNIKIQNANVGLVKEKSVLMLKSKIKYDTRYFKKVFVLEKEKEINK